MRSSGKVIAALLALGLAPRCEAGGAGGAAPFDFLFLDAGARPVALGGAYVSLARDANALLYNPAGLGRLERHHLTVMHNSYFQGITQEYGAFAYKIGKDEEESARYFKQSRSGPPSGWGVMVNTLSYGKIERTTLSNPDGAGGSFGIQDWAFAFGYGRGVGESFSLGASVKGLYEKIDRYSLFAPAADLGVLYSPEFGPLTAGLALQNLGPPARGRWTSEELPANLRAGAAWRGFEGGVLTVDVNKRRAGPPTVHAGAEYTAFKRVAMRLGYNGRNEADSGIAMGFGLLLPGAAVDYAFAPFGGLGNAHRISLSLNW